MGSPRNAAWMMQRTNIQMRIDVDDIQEGRADRRIKRAIGLEEAQGVGVRLVVSAPDDKRNGLRSDHLGHSSRQSLMRFLERQRSIDAPGIGDRDGPQINPKLGVDGRAEESQIIKHRLG